MNFTCKYVFIRTLLPLTYFANGVLCQVQLFHLPETRQTLYILLMTSIICQYQHRLHNIVGVAGPITPAGVIGLKVNTPFYPCRFLLVTHRTPSDKNNWTWFCRIIYPWSQNKLILWFWIAQNALASLLELTTLQKCISISNRLSSEFNQTFGLIFISQSKYFSDQQQKTEQAITKADKVFPLNE